MSPASKLPMATGKPQLTREAFDALIEPMVARSLKACRRAVRDSGIELEDVHRRGHGRRFDPRTARSRSRRRSLRSSSR